MEVAVTLATEEAVVAATIVVATVVEAVVVTTIVEATVVVEEEEGKSLWVCVWGLVEMKSTQPFDYLTVDTTEDMTVVEAEAADTAVEDMTTEGKLREKVTVFIRQF